MGFNQPKWGFAINTLVQYQSKQRFNTVRSQERINGNGFVEPPRMMTHHSERELIGYRPPPLARTVRPCEALKLSILIWGLGCNLHMFGDFGYTAANQNCILYGSTIL